MRNVTLQGLLFALLTFKWASAVKSSDESTNTMIGIDAGQQGLGLLVAALLQAGQPRCEYVLMGVLET